MSPYKLALKYFVTNRELNLFETSQGIRDTEAFYYKKSHLGSKLIGPAKNLMFKGNALPYQTVLDGQDSILRMLADYLIPNNPFVALPSKVRSAAIVKLVLEYIHSKSHRTFNISHITRFCFCSNRTLEYAFKCFLITIPRQYICNRALNGTHIQFLVTYDY
jgi:hypothetical protein